MGGGGVRLPHLLINDTTMMPPKDVTGAQMWAEITQCPREFRLVPFPRAWKGEQVEVAMVILTQEESFLANLAAEKNVRKMLRDDMPAKGSDMTEGYVKLFELAAGPEILFRACRNPLDIGKPFFRTREEISKFLTTDEIGILLREYTMVRVEMGPILTELTADEMDAWIDRLTEAEDLYPLVLLDAELLNRALRTMVSRLKALRTEKNSATSPPDEPTTDE